MKKDTFWLELQIDGEMTTDATTFDNTCDDIVSNLKKCIASLNKKYPDMKLKLVD